ncbi:hypothetical protein Salat_0484600 [Sesamum alatum]|uniref:Uncharacterized protein n=1 Tax=Sesamum alatum TaxID=300844 RepID=A0AAE2D0I4_9LAMI|nr:hypothetical protein Salat_0484600 [Sesamum alatum]
MRLHGGLMTQRKFTLLASSSALANSIVCVSDDELCEPKATYRIDSFGLESSHFMQWFLVAVASSPPRALLPVEETIGPMAWTEQLRNCSRKYCEFPGVFRREHLLGQITSFKPARPAAKTHQRLISGDKDLAMCNNARRWVSSFHKIGDELSEGRLEGGGGLNEAAQEGRRERLGGLGVGRKTVFVAVERHFQQVNVGKGGEILFKFFDVHRSVKKGYSIALLF